MDKITKEKLKEQGAEKMVQYLIDGITKGELEMHEILEMLGEIKFILDMKV